MPAGFDYPRDEQGQYMIPLAQINFREVPPLPGYPSKGYLQLYISAYDDLQGMNLENLQDQKNFRVLFFEEEDVQECQRDFSFLDEVMKYEYVPVYKPCAPQADYAGIRDVRIEKNMHFNFNAIVQQYPDISNELHDTLYNAFSCSGHKMGGYAYFTQIDPRTGNDELEKYLLLFQLDSDEENTNWGDCGVANFFIHPADLARKDFSKVMYTWDCT
jgi:uncharacterized protein YwqG